MLAFSASLPPLRLRNVPSLSNSVGAVAGWMERPRECARSGQIGRRRFVPSLSFPLSSLSFPTGHRNRRRLPTQSFVLTWPVIIVVGRSVSRFEIALAAKTEFIMTFRTFSILVFLLSALSRSGLSVGLGQQRRTLRHSGFSTSRLQQKTETEVL